MSFILDALRKSDAERQRAATPGLSDVRYATRPRERNVWLPVLGVFLAVALTANVAFMAIQWTRSDSPPAPEVPAAMEPRGTAPVQTPAPVPVPPVAAPAPPVAAAPPAAIRPLAREVGGGVPPVLPDVEAEFPPPAAVADQTVAPSRVVIAEPEPAAPEPIPAKPSRIVSGNQLPTVEQLIGSGDLDIPMLNLDLHVYSEAAATRFVIINSRKYKEGSRLSEGPTVESITSDGVILSSQGRRFTLGHK